jgi:hypothetical protein
MSILVKTDDPIRLTFMLSDGVELLPKVVKAILRKEDGTLLQPDAVILAHMGQGLFKNFAVLMPEDVIEVTATYIVYEEDGITESIDYAQGLDTFQNVDLIGIGTTPTEGLSTSTLLNLATAFADAIEVTVPETEVIEVFVTEGDI